MSRGPWLGCVADDYTGATDVAAGLRRSGIRTRLVFGVPSTALDISDTDAVVVALKTRTAPVADAVAQSRAATRWLLGRGVEQLYVKYCSTFDSTPTGNIGPVLDAVLDDAGQRLTVLCPASPEHGRTVFHGHLFVADHLLSESSMATHPLTPMTDADLRRVLAPQTPHAIGLLDHAVLAAGTAAARERLERLASEGIRHVVADAVDEADLAVLAAACAGLRVVSGGAGLARAMASGRPVAGTAPLTLPDGPAVVVAGSCSNATLEQVEQARAAMPSFKITPLLSDDPEEIWSMTQTWLDEHLDSRTGKPVLVYSSATAAERATSGHVFDIRTPDVLETLLARTARHAVDRGARRVVVAGGETSGAVVQALGVGSVDIGQEADTGVPWCLTPGPDPVALLLKSGNFGRPDLLVRAVA
ncbi:3-oxo-tetronate kinase [Intrasporangium flavum]|uniref:3-oxo-tetronate kinase n=1 Tax=Intrasporangium flavum TaxID=1428657 RepID=UPI00096C12FE|nr:3-oxo-tetronate kinase [Intrasporangium flavum]